MKTEVIYQTDPQFPATFETACCFLSLLWKFNDLFDVPEWTHTAIIKVYQDEQVKHDIDVDETIENPQGFADNVCGKGKLLYRGKFDATYQTAADEFELLVFHREGADFDHFCVGNGYSQLAFDPYSAAGSLSAKEGQLISKRIYKIL